MKAGRQDENIDMNKNNFDCKIPIILRAKLCDLLGNNVHRWLPRKALRMTCSRIWVATGVHSELWNNIIHRSETVNGVDDI